MPDRFIERVAREEGLAVHRSLPSSGLMNGFDQFEAAAGKVNPKIDNFYRMTSAYNLEVWTQWKPVFGSFGFLVYKLFSQRVQQLSLPQNALDTALGLKSDIISLINSAGKTIYRVWYRRLKKNDEVVYSGIYTHCILPSGKQCLKIIFPLPQGSATVIKRVSADADGNLLLESRGKEYGDSGFYFIVKDRRGRAPGEPKQLPDCIERIESLVVKLASVVTDRGFSSSGNSRALR